MFFYQLRQRCIFVGLLLLLIFIVYFFIFYPIYTSNHVIISFAVHPFDMCKEYPNGWLFIKKLFLFFSVVSHLIIFNTIFSSLVKNSENKKSKTITSDFPTNGALCLEVGQDSNKNVVYLPEKGLFQNILVTGTIGTGKTSSAMYPFTKQLIQYNHSSPDEKIGALILDVKGNYYRQVQDYCRQCHRLQDLIILGLNNHVFYNPLDKPHLKASILAHRLKTILLLFSPNNSESFWLDKAEQILSECIKLCRIYNEGYVTFQELHKLITVPQYYEEKINLIRHLFKNGSLSKEDCFNLLSSIQFFEKEFLQLDDRTLAILKSEITRITSCFISDMEVLNTFCPSREKINFNGFHDVLKQGKIVVLNMNIAEYRNLSKLIAAYLKLDFQTEVMQQLGIAKPERIVAFISDEYHEYVTATDAEFFAQSREAKCINIVATQSYTSLLNTLKDKYTVNTITQNLINKIWFRTDDILTIEDAQKQIGKEEKIKYSKSIAENAKTTDFNYFTKKFNASDSNLSESINTYSQFDFIYDTNYFTQKLETFHSVIFLSTGNKILPPQEIKMFPYFI